MDEPGFPIGISQNRGDPDTEMKFYRTFKKSLGGWCGQCVISSALGGGFSGQLTQDDEDDEDGGRIVGGG